MNIAVKLTAGAFLACTAGLAATDHFQSSGAVIPIDEFRPQRPPSQAAAILLLYGSGGLNSRNLPVRKEARALAALGYSIYLPNYLNATHGSAANPEQRYPIWVQSSEDAATYIRSKTGLPRNRIALIGYSLGASVALATAAQDPQFAAVIGIGGSLPDRSFRSTTTMPPLLIIHGQDDAVVPFSNAQNLASLCRIRHLTCEVAMYPSEGHAFSRRGLIDMDHRMEAFLKAKLPIQ